MKNKRGIFFSTDALIAISIIFITILIAVPLFTYTKPRSNLQYDVLNTFSTLKVADVMAGTNANAKSAITDAVRRGYELNENNSILQTIGELYIKYGNELGNPATELTDALLSTLTTNQNIGLFFGDIRIDTPRTGSSPYSQSANSNIDAATQIISGIQAGSNITGFSARAYLSSTLQTKYYYFGGYVGDGNITARIDYSGNISSAFFEGVINGTGSNFTLLINNVPQGYYNFSSSETTPTNFTILTNNFINATPGSVVSNNISFEGDNLHIAGGYIKITYQSNVEYQQATKDYFPGIRGLINIYTGVYIPDTLHSLSAMIHFNSTYPIFMTIGNTTIYNGTSTNDDSIQLSDSNIRGNLTSNGITNYDPFTNNTIPIRIGLQNVSYLLTGTRSLVDIISVTDISGSMAENCGPDAYADPGETPCKINDAKNATHALINIILGYAGNRVGLTAYSDWASKDDFYQLTNDTAPLNNTIENIWRSKSSTCICCGILKAINCYDSKILSDDFTSYAINSQPISWDVNPPGRSSIKVSANSLDGDGRAVLINGTSNDRPNMYRLFAGQDENLVVRFLIKLSSANGNGTAKIIIDDERSRKDFIILKVNSTNISNNNQAITKYSLNNIAKIQINITAGSSTYNLYVNDVLVGANLPVNDATTIPLGIINFTTELKNVSYTIDNVTITLPNQLCTDTNNINRTRTAIVMSDGEANAACGFNGNTWASGTDAINDAVNASCLAHNTYNITVFTVGFNITAAGRYIMKNISACGGGVYYEADVNGIVEIYKKIADTVINASYSGQRLVAVGDFNKTILYPDSYIQYDYNQIPTPIGSLLSLESKFYPNTYGSFFIPQNSTIVQANVISYSGQLWTKSLIINNYSRYNLSNYILNYTSLGDPFVLGIPLKNLSSNNNDTNVTLTIAIGRNYSEVPGSNYNKIIYTVVKNLSSFTNVKPNSGGCNWNIEFEDGTITNPAIRVPSSYSGPLQCYYTQANHPVYTDSPDAITSATYALLRQIDTDRNWKVDINLDPSLFQISSSEITGIPYPFATKVQVRTWD